jgi:hypothetical protein
MAHFGNVLRSKDVQGSRNRRRTRLDLKLDLSLDLAFSGADAVEVEVQVLLFELAVAPRLSVNHAVF